MFSYFESSVDGIIPNEYCSLETIACALFSYVTYLKDCCMLTARRFWLVQTQLSPKSIFRLNPRADKANESTTNTSNAPNNINIRNNLHNLNSNSNINKKLQSNEKFFLLTNNEIRDGVLKNVDTFNNIDAMNSMQQYSKKDN